MFARRMVRRSLVVMAGSHGGEGEQRSPGTAKRPVDIKLARCTITSPSSGPSDFNTQLQEFLARTNTGTTGGWAAGAPTVWRPTGPGRSPCRRCRRWWAGTTAPGCRATTRFPWTPMTARSTRGHRSARRGDRGPAPGAGHLRGAPGRRPRTDLGHAPNHHRPGPPDRRGRFLTRALKAPTLRESVAPLVERARGESWTHEEFLVACLQGKAPR